MRRNIGDPLTVLLTGILTGLLCGRLCGSLTGQARMRRLRGRVRWEGNLDESRLGRPFEYHQQVAHP